MSEAFTLELNVRNLRNEISNYSLQHPNDFGVPDGKERIPMKKLMKMFNIKKKTAPETQNLFRQLVNEHCELEIKEEIGKVLVLIPNDEYDDSTSYGDSDDDELDYGYGEAAPDTVTELVRSESDEQLKSSNRPARFKPPIHSASGGLTVASTDTLERRTGYRRRGSVTRYSIVGQDQVIAEYKKHEDVINQFRRDSLKLENSIRNMSLNGSNHTNSEAFSVESPKKQPTPAQKKKEKAMKNGGVRKLLGRSRFSLAF
mmetsp:Transcript_22471/g.55706  ORF Transcript_22471/g.55706 Transcript_22471/m.55706 type:complete len:258 (-) Transcript_22471:422-1195(-)